MADSPRPVFRFAPTPNGLLHLGHAYSALMNAQRAQEVNGILLLRLDDLDATRARPEFIAAIDEDLAWLGIAFASSVRRQSRHLRDYDAAIAMLSAQGLVYACGCSRLDIARANPNLSDPDGAPLHRRRCRAVAPEARMAWRLDMAGAIKAHGAGLTWREFGEAEEALEAPADPAAWGDISLAGKERRASYHLSVVVDDAAQEISDVVRGRDLRAATSAHRLLQQCLGLAAPRYRHHRLAMQSATKKMSKSDQSTSLRALRGQGYSAQDLRVALGFAAGPAMPLPVALS